MEEHMSTLLPLPKLHPEEHASLEKLAGRKLSTKEAQTLRRKKLEEHAAHEYVYGDKRERI
jgi:hypothetical protein